MKLSCECTIICYDGDMEKYFPYIIPNDEVDAWMAYYNESGHFQVINRKGYFANEWPI